MTGCWPHDLPLIPVGHVWCFHFAITFTTAMGPTLFLVHWRLKPFSWNWVAGARSVPCILVWCHVWKCIELYLRVSCVHSFLIFRQRFNFFLVFIKQSFVECSWLLTIDCFQKQREHQLADYCSIKLTVTLILILYKG